MGVSRRCWSWGRIIGRGLVGGCTRANKVFTSPDNGNRRRIDAGVGGADLGTRPVIGPGDGHARRANAASYQLEGRLRRECEATGWGRMGQQESRSGNAL